MVSFSIAKKCRPQNELVTVQFVGQADTPRVIELEVPSAERQLNVPEVATF